MKQTLKEWAVILAVAAVIAIAFLMGADDLLGRPIIYIPLRQEAP